MELDMTQYLDVFLEESREHIRNLNSRLLELEKNPGETSGLNEIFRSAHTLKGMSSTMGFVGLADLTHHMENLLSELKEGKMPVTTRAVDILFACIDRLQIIIDNIEGGNKLNGDNSELIKALETIWAGQADTAAAETMRIERASEPSENIPVKSPRGMIYNDYDITILKEALSRGFNVQYLKIGVAPNSMMKAVRVFMVFKALEEAGEVIKSDPSAQELDEGKFDDQFDLVYICQGDLNLVIERINQISEVKLLQNQNLDPTVLTVTEPTPQVVPKLTYQPAGDQADQNKIHHMKQTVRVDIERLDKLMNLVGELVMHKGRLEQIGSAYKLEELNNTIEHMDRITSDLQAVVMKVRMVPVEQVFNRFPRMVRDLAKELNKEVDFYIEGKETELDRTVIDEIGDPLLHLLRNALDHGLESPQQRLLLGKPGQGRLYLRAHHEGNNVFIEVEDDGAGIKTGKVRARAVENGLLGKLEAEQLSDEAANMLIFESGFSTADIVTDISGRGVGMDVVKSKIEAMNGEIIVNSRPGSGSLFRIKLPLTLAIIQAMMVTVQNEIYAIPLTSVDETTMISIKDIKNVQGQEFITLRGSILPLLRLARLVDLPEDGCDSEEIYVVVVRKGSKQFGLVVDTLIGQQEIVIKSLGKILDDIPGIAGAIISGDGNVCLILDITTLF
ncbi:MAG TPA: chemotaxis protein CheA [Syntrophomonas sp.]|nr:chemotaxis protein CheA [Syntrophomonas sp.]